MVGGAVTRECHEEVSRKGELQPCDKPAVAERVDPEFDSLWYPVCTTHTRGTCRPLNTPPTPDECEAMGDGHEFYDMCSRCGVEAYVWFNR